MSAAVFGSGIPSPFPSISSIVFVLWVNALAFIGIGLGAAFLVHVVRTLKNCIKENE